jgi:hypothetical protein
MLTSAEIDGLKNLRIDELPLATGGATTTDGELRFQFDHPQIPQLVNQIAPPAMEGTIEILSLSLTAVASFSR